MRLSDVLSKPLSDTFTEVDGFLDNKRLKRGKQKKIAIGRIALTFFCRTCNDFRTFCSDEDLYCIGVNDQMVSIDSALKCPCCESSVQTWFLVISSGDISSLAPSIRILKRCERLSDSVVYDGIVYNFADLLEKAQKAYHEDLGAGSIIYLRKVFEQITTQTANAVNIPTANANGKPKTFQNLLREVDQMKSIIPKEFSENGYTLYRELSEVLHGNFDEQASLQKYEALRRLVMGILDNVKNNHEMVSAINDLGWQREEAIHE